MRKHIYVFGNEQVPIDSRPVSLLPELQKEFPQVTFVHADPTDNWLQEDRNPIIIDTVVGLKEVTLFDSLDSFSRPDVRITPHDYDLFLDLSLMLKLKKIDRFLLIGIPPDGNAQKMIAPVTKLLRSMFF